MSPLLSRAPGPGPISASAANFLHPLTVAIAFFKARGILHMRPRFSLATVQQGLCSLWVIFDKMRVIVSSKSLKNNVNAPA